VVAINAMRCCELPFARAASAKAPIANRVDLLFNEPSFNVDRAPAEAISIPLLAASLGEAGSAFAWSHLGLIPVSSRCLFHPFVRVCAACLAMGFHSALFSLKLLRSCPIHQRDFISTCRCGRYFDPKIARQTRLIAGYCVCGRSAYFTRETCRRPTMDPQDTQALLPIVAWLAGLSTVSRPVPKHAGSRQAHEDKFLPSLTAWCNALGIAYPACLRMQNEAASFSHSETPLSRGTISHALQKRLHAVERRSTTKPRRFTLWRDDEATTVYRAMARHLRRHVTRGAERFAVGFMLRANPLEMARTMQTSRQAMVAFADLIFHRCMERYALQRRWPYRNPQGDWWQLEDSFDARDIESGHEQTQGLTPANKAWLARQAAGARVVFAWRRAQATASAAVRTGIADWRCANLGYFREQGSLLDDAPFWSWYLAPPPFQVSWATAVVEERLRFVSSPAESRIDWTLPQQGKATRVQAQLQADQARWTQVDAACKGPCLTWTVRDGWQVLESARPGRGAAKRHRLLGDAPAGSRFWLFGADGSFVARSCEYSVQALGPSPREAISNLRTAMRQYHRHYGSGRPVGQPLEVCGTPCRMEFQRELDTRVRRALYTLGFWGGAWGLNNIAMEHLARDRRLPAEDICKAD
jgi:hypothetical protein